VRQNQAILSANKNSVIQQSTAHSCTTVNVPSQPFPNVVTQPIKLFSLNDPEYQ